MSSVKHNNRPAKSSRYKNQLLVSSHINKNNNRPKSGIENSPVAVNVRLEIVDARVDHGLDGRLENDTVTGPGERRETERVVSVVSGKGREKQQTNNTTKNKKKDNNPKL